MRRTIDREEGSALIMVLVFTMTMAIILGAVLTLVETSQKNTVALRGEATSTYAVDGAIQQAVNTMQRGKFINAEESAGCFGASDTSEGADLNQTTISIPDPDGTGSIAVECSGTPGSGVQSPEVPITSVNTPGNAILTLGSANTDGLNVESTYNLFSRFDVGGPVFAHGPIKTNGRSLAARGYVRARGACSDASKITPTPQCNYSGYDGGLDPNYSLPSTAGSPSILTYRTVPSTTCSSMSQTVTFEPGYYDDAAALNAVTSRGCTYWFKPGNYYFDFHNGDNSALAASSHEWKITDGRLIGGTRMTSASLLWALLGYTVSNQDCRSPLKSTTNAGVRFVFGGNSRLSVSGQGSAVICGTYSSSEPAIAVQGVKTGSETSQSANGLVATGQSAVQSFVRDPGNTAATAWQGVTSQNDSITAKWAKTGNNSQTGYLELTGFAPSTAVPPGAVIDSATVRVRRSNAAAQSADAREVVLTIGGNACTLPVPDTASASLVNADLNVLTACPAAFVQALHVSGVPTTGTKLRYNVTLTRAGTELLDHVTLDVTYRSPAYRAQGTATGDTCNLSATYVPNYDGGSDTGCAGLNLRSSIGSIISGINNTAINGTVYTPVSAMAVRLDAFSSSGLRSGVITRSLYLRAAGILTFASVASVPFASMGTDPSAYLTAYRCETASTCSAATGTAKVRAKVTLIGQTVTAGTRREAKIVSYSVLQ